MKLATLFTFFFALSTLAVSQSKTFIGIRGGGQFSSAYITHTVRPYNFNSEFTQTINAGLVVKHFNFKSINKLGINAGIQSGVNYVQKGWKQEFTPLSGIEPYEIQLDYLEFPIEAVLYGGKGSTKFFGTMGIYYERLIENKDSNRPNEDELGRDEFETYVRERDPEDGYGLRGSLGGMSTFPFGTLQLVAFSSVSFSGVFEFDNRTTEVPDQSNLYVIGVSLGYFIGFGKMDF